MVSYSSLLYCYKRVTVLRDMGCLLCVETLIYILPQTLQWYVQYNVILHDDVIKWNHFPCNWPFVRGIHRSPVNSPHKGQWRGALMFTLICVWINDWVNNPEAGDLRRYRAHYDVIVMRPRFTAPNYTRTCTYIAGDRSKLFGVHVTCYTRIHQVHGPRIRSVPTKYNIEVKHEHHRTVLDSVWAFCTDTTILRLHVKWFWACRAF